MRTCLNCRWEPEWHTRHCFDGITQTSGRCQYGHPSPNRLHKLGLPQGARLEVPMIYHDKPKHNCGAWQAKEMGK